MVNATLPPRASGILDNLHRGNVGGYLQEKITPGADLLIASAYFTIYAYRALQAQLDGIERLRFLFGEPHFIRSLDPSRSDGKAFRIEDDRLHVANRLQQSRAARECADWIGDKVEVRSVRQANLLHGKLYHITDAAGREDAIVGSSNFTLSGLGLAHAGNNIELSVEVDSKRDISDLRNWFLELWDDPTLVEDVKPEVLAYLAQLYQNNSPQFIYYKTLYHIFAQYLADQQRDGLAEVEKQIVDTEIWNALFEFQKDGVKGAINKLLAYGGCILADSVGLGKTYEALAVIKYFELRNQRVLVLCPKKLRENWTVYQAHNASGMNPFLKDRLAYTVLSHTDLSRESGYSGDVDLATLAWGNFDLVVIDESHNFRNDNPGKRDEDGNLVRRSRYQRLLEDVIAAGVPTKVLLLSATPVNNTLRDLRNQINLFTEGRDDAFAEGLGIVSLRDTLAVAQRTFTDWARRSDGRATSDLLESFSSAFFRLLDAVTIARSRKHIERYYADTVARLGGFPERNKPLSVYPEIDLRGEFASYDALNDKISAYRLALFNPTAYVREDYVKVYEAAPRPAQLGLAGGASPAPFTQARREMYLIGMMKVNFMKRLESSVHSFRLTAERTVAKIDALTERIAAFRQHQAEHPDFDYDDLVIDDLEDEDLQAILSVGTLNFKFAHLELDGWLADLESDRRHLDDLAKSASQITPERDAKLAALQEIIARKAAHPTVDKEGRPNRKVLVFTAFADTAEYLYRCLRPWARGTLGLHTALVTGAGTNRTTLGHSDFYHILTNFSPIAKQRDRMHGMPQGEEIDLLIATDCISEGQNLQDCDLLVNYDVHWNPVRVIQRFGRIDRIGSLHHAVQLVNFWPTAELDKYIALKNRVEARMALVDITATNEDNILNTEALKDLVVDELKYRDRQLLRLRDEVLDLEDFDEGLSLTDFTLDDFRAELLRFIEANREQLEEAPLGLYAVVPPDPQTAVGAPGVIFCLRLKGQEADGTDKPRPQAVEAGGTVNPLHPYYLVYIRDDGEVRFTFAQPKQILELYRALCAGQASPHEALCTLFDQDTANGEDLALYDDLLRKAIASIERTFRKRAASGLLSSRDAVLLPRDEQASAASEFDLITWLVIKENTPHHGQ
jgi:hypothetical protein